MHPAQDALPAIRIPVDPLGERLAAAQEQRMTTEEARHLLWFAVAWLFEDLL